MPEDLPEGYYLDNFEYLLDFVRTRYEDLLGDEEKQFCNRFFSLSDDARKLYVRLTNRKGSYFRVDKIIYAEISDHQLAFDELSVSGFVEKATWLELEDVLRLLFQVGSPVCLY